MFFEFEIEFVLAVMLVSIRIGAIFLLTPLFSIGNIPVRIRVLLVMALSLMFVLLLKEQQAFIDITVKNIFETVIYEVTLGLMLAFGVFAVFATFNFGGRMIDYQMGFGVANLIDPVTHSQEPLLGTMLNIMAVMVFYLVDGHHLLIQGLLYSFQVIPPGTMLSDAPVGEVIKQFGAIFTFGMALVAPVVFVLFLLDVALAIAARTMPQVNMFIVSIPIKIFVGLMVLALSIAYMAPLLTKIYMSIFEYWQSVLE